MAYATPANLIARYDYRAVGELASDSGTALSTVAIETDPNVLAALDDASGEVESALLQGGRYTVAQLNALTGNSQAKLIRITCDIAYLNLWGRRTYVNEDQHYENAVRRVKEALKALRTGENIFNVDDHVDAGLPEAVQATRVEVMDQNLMRDYAHAYYPQRRFPKGY